MDFYDRLKALIKREKLKIAAFEDKMRFSNGSLSKALKEKRGIGSDRLETIFSHYPNWSADWLFKEQGEMYVPENFNKGVSDPNQSNNSQTTPNDLRKTIAALEKVDQLRELVLNEYKTQLDNYKRNDQNVEKRQ